MTTPFPSRLGSLRQKKISINEEQSNLRLTLPPDISQKTYEPTTVGGNTRTSFRLLKGRIDKTQSRQKNQTNSNLGSSKGMGLNLPEEKYEMKLRINDDPLAEEKKAPIQPPKIPLQKRILIAKQPPKEEPKKQQIPKRQEPVKYEQPIQSVEERPINNHEEKPIKEEDLEQSGVNENELIECPEGCGRKFNRNALPKHSKACKIVFMSKRKEFNSEAKRITSKQQAVIAKQNKIKQKKQMGVTKGKGFGQTGDNWKAASEDFRSAVKGFKKQQKQQKEEQEEEQEQGLEGQVNVLADKKVIMITCQHCEKQFNEVFIETHIDKCPKKKQKQRQRSKKKPPKK